MIPILYSASEKKYTGHGIGPLSDAKSALVNWEANGAYVLRVQLPQSSPHLRAIAPGVQILAKPNPYDQAQPFRVKRPVRPLKGLVEIYAEHIAYDLNGVPIAPFTASTAAQAVGYMNSKRLGGETFTFSTNLNVSNPMTVEKPTAAWRLLGGQENTLLYNYGGELVFDRRTVRLLSSAGANRGFAIRYGVNMTGLQYEESGEDFYTGVLPFWSDNEGTLVTGSILSASGSFGFSKILPLDLSQDFEEQPSTAQLAAAASEYISKNKIGQPIFRIRASFVPPGSRGLKTLEDVRFYDKVTVQHARYGIDIEASVVKTSYDVLRERYQSVEIGNRLISVAQTIAEPVKRIADDAVKESTIAKRAVTASKIGSGAVTSAKIGSGAVGSAALAAGAVTAAKLANNSVTVLKIEDGAVVTEKIATDAVTAAKLLNGAVTVDKIVNGAVVSEKIATDAVTATKILDGSVTGPKVLDQAIAYAKLSGSLQVFYNDTIAANAMFAGVIYAQRSVSCSTLIVDGHQFTPGQISFIDGLQNQKTYNVLMFASE